MYSLSSTTAFAKSSSFKSAARRPQLPTVGLSTAGYPIDRNACMTPSSVKATRVSGVGTPAFFSAMLQRSLSLEFHAV